MQRAFMHLRRCIRLSGMTDVAVFNRPGDAAIVAGTAIFAVDDFHHVDLVAAGLKFEAKIAVTDFAAKSHAVKPMWKDHRAHARLVGKVIDYDIAIFGTRR